MELLILVIIAGVVGYFLAGSRFSKPIDDTTGKVADTTRDLAGKTESWFTRTFRRNKEPSEEVIEAAAQPVEEAKPAARQSSRRRDEGADETQSEG